MKLCFATNNIHKLNEIKALIGFEFEILSLADIGCNESLPEDQETLQGNSLQKAEYVWKNYQVSCFSDDTGLEVDALNGQPGVYAARYAGERCDFDDNINLLLKNLSGIKDRKARFISVITLILDGKVEQPRQNRDFTYIQFEGIINGEILTEKRGQKGFGYDPVFKPEGYDVSFAEIEPEEKNKISHRGIAIRKLVEYLKLTN
ncbi:MAG: RdgB/HAM1 family non-canonical purine NTP pyrophosphatase [Cytophagales bacterium]|nr:RdgB/HAM1 family non-canonical purine NTP pyrophosphatase [Cytophagales bacterium]